MIFRQSVVLVKCPSDDDDSDQKHTTFPLDHHEDGVLLFTAPACPASPSEDRETDVTQKHSESLTSEDAATPHTHTNRYNYSQLERFIALSVIYYW